MNRIGRLTVATASAGVLLVAGAGSAFAHECYNAKRPKPSAASSAMSPVRPTTPFEQTSPPRPLDDP